MGWTVEKKKKITNQVPHTGEFNSHDDMKLNSNHINIKWKSLAHVTKEVQGEV